MFWIHYKHEKHGSYVLDSVEPFKCLDDAQRFILRVQENAEREGFCAWVGECTLWVTDEHGNIY